MRIKAYTDYYGECEEVWLLSYDNDKYVTVERSCGDIEEIKSCYCYRKPFKFNEDYSNKAPYLHRVTLHILGGGNPKYFSNRKEKLDWYKHNHSYDIDGYKPKIKNLKEAVKIAKKLCLQNNTEWVYISNFRNKTLNYYGVSGDGCVYECPRGSNQAKFKRTLSKYLGYKFPKQGE